MSTFLFVRHGETEWTRTDRIQGWAPVPLTERGHSQARRVGAFLADEYAVDAVLSSDILRAYQTAEAIGDALDCPVETDLEWRERDFGLLQGLADATAEDLDSFRSPENGPLLQGDRGESWTELEQRVQTAWQELQRTHDGETVVVVTHTGVLLSLVTDIQDFSEEEARSLSFSEGGVTEVRVPADGAPAVTATDLTDHLTSEHD